MEIENRKGLILITCDQSILNPVDWVPVLEKTYMLKGVCLAKIEKKMKNMDIVKLY